MHVNPNTPSTPLVGSKLQKEETSKISALFKKTPFFVGKGTDVGILGKDWTCPSDHLPIGITINGDCPIHIVTWNVLNREYMKFVYGDYQGLNGSTMTEEDVVISDDGLTKRDQHCADIIREMVVSKDQSKSIIALQECGIPFLNYLNNILPPHINIVRTVENDKDRSVILYDSSVFNCNEVSIKKGLFEDRPERSVVNILLDHKTTGARYRCITAHLPWIVEGKAPKELADYVKEEIKNKEIVILMGDMNRTEIEIHQSFEEAGLADFQQFSPYCTFIPYVKDGIYTQSAAFDHFFVFNHPKDSVKENSPEEVSPGLSKMVKILHGEKSL